MEGQEPQGGAGAADPQGGGQGIAYLSQISPELRADKAVLEALKDAPKLNDLVSSYVKAKGRLGRSVVVPSAENPDPEEVKAFRAAMGLPEKAEGYEFKTDTFKDVPALEEIVKAARAHAAAMSLTKTQAQKYLENIVGLVQAGRDAQTAAVKQAEDTFEARLLEAVGKDEAKKAAAINLAKAGLVRQFGQKEGMLAKLKEAGLLADPDFITSIAATEERFSGAPFHKGSGEQQKPGAPRGAQGNYSAEFEAQFGANRKGA